tara:strand:- start:169 stop:390 length:222 start_codon:yes stop_codon:yes gene_type:complete
MLENESQLRSDFSYGYFIDEDGLFYYSEMDGITYECFDINGVASTTFDFETDYRILELAYIHEYNGFDESGEN